MHCDNTGCGGWTCLPNIPLALREQRWENPALVPKPICYRQADTSKAVHLHRRLAPSPSCFCRQELSWCTEGTTQSRKRRLAPNAETINLRQTRSRLGQQKACDPADYNSRAVHRSTELIINFQVHDEPLRAPIAGRAQPSPQAVDETALASIPIASPA